MYKPVRVLIAFLLLVAATSLAEAAGPRLRWKRSTINIAISNSLLRENPNIAVNADVKGAMERSFEAWRDAANISFKTKFSHEQNVSPAGSRGDGISVITIAQTPENLALFPEGLNDASARTRVFFDRRGFITEADIVLNPYLQYSTSGTIGTFDLESTITHELGHLLGLPHSPVLGATMHENIGKNGIFSIPQLSSRTLSEDDVSAVRGLYGAPAGEMDCCGKISGRLLDSNGRAAKGVLVWAEEKSTSRVVSETVTADTGNFRFDALPEGEYRIWAQAENKGARQFAADELDEVVLEKNASVTVHKKLSNRNADFDAKYLGFNGQLAELAVALSASGAYTIYVGGSNLDPKKLRVGTNSPSISVVDGSLVSQDFGDDISVMSFQIVVDSDIPFGEYSLYVEDGDGAKSFLVGGLSIEKFSNPWGSFTVN